MKEWTDFEYEQLLETETPEERTYRLQHEDATPLLRNARIRHDQRMQTESDMRPSSPLDSEEMKLARANRNNWIENQKREATRPDPASQMATLNKVLAPAAQRDEGTRFIALELPYLLGDKAAQERFKAFLSGDQTQGME